MLACPGTLTIWTLPAQHLQTKLSILLQSNLYRQRQYQNHLLYLTINSLNHQVSEFSLHVGQKAKRNNDNVVLFRHYTPE
ncbi:hypothetical protein CHARACLAT_005885 [Characodon lateralis]|uniref:Uncharacterized protein n=1 Tax=Characodon lateralis TaxID=208331 RepID=A0ABU7D4Z4_9TELE|nr:hypothetical protein [Characodon lateralis]